jgi:hypothetical protein
MDDGRIHVRHASVAINAMQGAATGGAVEYFVHPCQRNQFDAINKLLPADQQMTAEEAAAVPKPWWSLPTGERGGLRE